MSRPRRALALAVLALAAPACGSRPEGVRLGQPVAVTESSLPAEPGTTASPSTTVAPATTVAATIPRITAVPGPPPPPPPGLGTGARGPEVMTLEQRLDALRYDVGAVDGVFDRVTGHAVIAFQKVHGMGRTGRATDDVLAAVESAAAGHEVPPPLVPGGGGDRVEVDIARQVLFLHRGGNLVKILPVSTGNNKRFCSEGWCRRAVTPGGSFSIYRQGSGWEYGPLGGLYKPQYFNGGIAIHGATSVPAGPASHGCVRIPMNAAEWFPSQVGHGTAVYVVGGPQDVPPPAPAPPPPSVEPAPTVPAPVSPEPLLGSLLNPPSTTVPASAGGA